MKNETATAPNDLRRKRAEVSQKTDALAALEKEGTELSEAQVTEFYTLSDEFEALTGKINRQEAAEKQAAITAKPLKVAGTAKVDIIKLLEHKGAKVARMVQAIGATQGGRREAAHYAETVLGDADVAMALNTGTSSAGGFLVPRCIDPIGYGLSKFDKLYHARQVMTDLLSTGIQA